MLKWVGHEAVAVLDGGLQAWEAADGAVETGAALPRKASAFSASTPKAQLATTDTVLQQLGRPAQTLVDARGAEFPAAFAAVAQAEDTAAILHHAWRALLRGF
jgi:thiosulfate/3-mercaptopyruvate sulfurtransferase